MIKFLEFLLASCIVVLIGGFTLTAMSLMLNEPEIGLMFAEITCYIVLPCLFIAVAIDVKYN
jgi:hypothetical protein